MPGNWIRVNENDDCSIDEEKKFPLSLSVFKWRWWRNFSMKAQKQAGAGYESKIPRHFWLKLIEFKTSL